jgi:hypothetical protein
MADNLYDILNRFTLGQAATAGQRLLGSMGLGLPGGPQAAGPFGPRGILGRSQGRSIQQRPVVNPEFLRPDYSGAGERARRFQEYQTGRNIPGANTDYAARLGGGSAAERAYQTEKSRVAQLTAQDPELQRYEAARKTAVAPGATPEQVQSAEDIGMQIWQQKYGNTPMGQVGGAVGTFNPLMQRTFGYQSGSAPGQQMGAPTLGPSPLVPQVDQSLNPASPTYISGEGPPLINFADSRFENTSPEEFQKLLNQVNKK